MRRLLVGALAATLAVTACGGEDDDEVALTATPAAVAGALEDTLGTGGRFTAVLTVDAGDGPADIELAGAFDGEGRLEVTADLGALAPLAGDVIPAALTGEVRAVFDREAVYVCGEFVAPFGGPCLSLPLGDQAGGLPLSDPFDSLHALVAGADDVEEAGVEDLDGVATTHLRGTITPRAALEQLAPDEAAQVESQLGAVGVDPGALDEPLAFDVWVDGDGRVRRYRQTAPNGGAVDLRVHDFGDDVTVEVPAGDDVVDLGSTVPGLPD